MKVQDLLRKSFGEMDAESRREELQLETKHTKKEIDDLEELVCIRESPYIEYYISLVLFPFTLTISLSLILIETFSLPFLFQYQQLKGVDYDLSYYYEKFPKVIHYLASHRIVSLNLPSFQAYSLLLGVFIFSIFGNFSFFIFTINSYFVTIRSFVWSLFNFIFLTFSIF